MYLFGNHFFPGFKTNFTAGLVSGLLLDTVIGEYCNMYKRERELESYRRKVAEEYRKEQM
ncbi:hypothetical protein F511_03763 [Dorcoceras hygrometricum]|uniref:Uncharacterized protein n=1 Tax=Dorcoceras hygrometricum TaxID=472368 RepID=A0A2Z7B6A1_9LAMI|nr:hypothetical protein F511_03763 [Dorcoceras hygrometricum]